MKEKVKDDIQVVVLLDVVETDVPGQVGRGR